MDLPLTPIMPRDALDHRMEAPIGLRSVAERPSPEKIREAGQEFEGFFIAYLLKAMRETVHSGLLKNQAGEMFYSFYDQELGRLAAQAGGLGLGGMIETYIQQQSLPMEPGELKFSSPPADTEAGGGQSLHRQSTRHEGRN